MQNGRKAVWCIPYVSVAFFWSLKQNFIAFRSSKVSSRPDCIFEIHQLWQSGFSRLYSNCCCSCWFEPEIIKISPSSYKMYSNKILNFQESTTILNTVTRKSGKSSKVSSRPDCIFEIHQLWQSDFSRLYSNCCSSCWFEPEIIKISPSSYKMYSSKILNFQESTTILNACTKSVWKLIESTTYIHNIHTNGIKKKEYTKIWL